MTYGLKAAEDTRGNTCKSFNLEYHVTPLLYFSRWNRTSDTKIFFWNPPRLFLQGYIPTPMGLWHGQTKSTQNHGQTVKFEVWKIFRQSYSDRNGTIIYVEYSDSDCSHFQVTERTTMAKDGYTMVISADANQSPTMVTCSCIWCSPIINTIKN